MKQNIRRLGMVMILVSLALLSLTACGSTAATTITEAEGESPVTVEHLEGKIPTRLKLTEAAAKRLDLQTDKTQDALVNETKFMSVPYGAILYDTNGKTWLYTSPEALTFERTSIVIDHIDGNTVFLSDGPAAGTAVVTQAVAELYGSETEFEEE